MEHSIPENKPENSEPKQTEPNNKESRIPQPAIPSIPPEPTSKHKQKTHRERAECREKWRLWLEVVGVAAAVIYALYTIKEWRTFDSERKTMEKESALDERAWVSIENPTVNWDDKMLTENGRTVYGMKAEFHNTGKTPAKIMRIKIKVGVACEPFTNTIWVVSTNIVRTNTIAPNGPQVSAWNEPAQITTKDIQLIRQQRRHDYFIWSIEYEDVFHDVHHTQVGFDVTGLPDDPKSGFVVGAYGESVMD